MKLMSIVLSLVLISQSLAGTLNMEFDEVVPGTITDIHGNGTSFTHRLLGTTDPPTAEESGLIIGSGLLNIEAASSYNPPVTGISPQTQALGIIHEGVGTADISVSATFKQLDISSSQAYLFIGNDPSHGVVAGLEAYQHNYGRRHGAHIVSLYATVYNGTRVYNSQYSLDLFLANVSLTLSRIQGMWQFSWANVDGGESGSTPMINIDMPTEGTVYTGLQLTSLNPERLTRQRLLLDNFNVTVVPEPVAFILVIITLLGLLASRLDR